MDIENEEKNVIREAEILAEEKPSEPTVVKVRKRRNDLYIELALFLILGILIGIALKNEAVKKVTMGFDDYKMKTFSKDYDLNVLQKNVMQKAEDAKAAAEASTAAGQQGAKEQAAPVGGENVPVGN